MKIQKIPLALKVTTWLAICVLIIATLAIIIRTVQSSELQTYVYIGGDSLIAVVHEEPRASSAVVTAIERGKVIYLLESEEVKNWAYVRIGEATGWVAIEHLSLNPP
jgi:hypothetical protein